MKSIFFLITSFYLISLSYFTLAPMQANYEKDRYLIQFPIVLNSALEKIETIKILEVIFRIRTNESRTLYL